MGMGEALSAAEPGGIFGGYPAPAPAAAGPEPVIPDSVVEPVLGGARLAHDRPAMGGGSEGGSVSAPTEGPGPVAPGAEADSAGQVGPDGQSSSDGEAGSDGQAGSDGERAGDGGGDSADLYVALGPDDAVMHRFVTDYLLLLDGRLDTIRRCLDDSDIEGARVAILSLESSSLMLGGGPLAARLSELRSQLDLGSTPQRNALLVLAESAASRFRSELEVVGTRLTVTALRQAQGAQPSPRAEPVEAPSVVAASQVGRRQDVSETGAPRAGSRRRARSRRSAAS